jgi:helicase required for RNAi-mediated heterochromatin assembly 1
MGVAVKVSFSLNRAGKKVNWKGSKRLVAGTLVCISQDNFQTFKVATVAARPMSGLELDPPEVDLLFNVDEIEIDVNKPFLMVESRSGYFEAFKWVLRAMQRMSEKTMALHNHIVGLDREVGPPQYVVDNPTYNLESVFPDSNQDLVKEMNILEEWPPELKNTMDEAQTEALRTILTKRVAVIQGPPGTGKTYTSVMALHALLQNMSEDDPPIIVACQTNHALDQLLKHVYEFEQDIIRLGGRTKETGPIKERTMFNVRKLASNVIIQGGGNPGHYSRQMDNVRQKMVELLQPLLPDFFSPETLFEYGQINAKQQKSLVDGVNDWVTARDDNKPSSIMALWLRDSIIPVQRDENIYSNMEEAEANYEALLDQEAEYQSGPGNVDDFKEELQGFWQSIIHKHTVRPEEEDNASIDKAMNTTNMWKIPAGLRAAVYERWAGEVTRHIREKIIVLNKEFSKLSKQLKIARMQKDAFLISQSKLVGMTTTGLSKYRSLIAACKPKVILIEEAAEVLEAPVLVGCLPDIQQMILVGDHQQLKGKCNVKDLEGEPYFLDTSLFERLVENDMPYVTLRTQRRK